MKCDIHVYNLIFCAEINKLTFKHSQNHYLHHLGAGGYGQWGHGAAHHVGGGVVDEM